MGSDISFRNKLVHSHSATTAHQKLHCTNFATSPMSQDMISLFSAPSGALHVLYAPLSIPSRCFFCSAHHHIVTQQPLCIAKTSSMQLRSQTPNSIDLHFGCLFVVCIFTKDIAKQSATLNLFS